MRRRATVGRKPAKTRHRKPTRPKRSSAAMTANQPNLSVSDLQEQLKRQARELDEAREERAALAEVLRLISSSPGELAPVFQSMLEHAVRMVASAAGGLVAIYWLDLGVAGFFAAVAVGFCLYAAMLVHAVSGVKTPTP